MMLYQLYSSMHCFAYYFGTAEEALLPEIMHPVKNNRIFLLVIIGLILSFTAFHFLALINYKRKRLREAYLTEQRISKKIHDEIANELYSTIHHVETTEIISGSEREHLIEKLNSIYSSTRDLSRETGSIDTGVPFSHQLKAMINDYKYPEINVIIKNIDAVKWNTINHITKVTLYRVLQELMVNMKKHSGATIVIFEFISDSKHLVIKYKDNGKGLPDYLYIKNGLANVENRMETIKGTAIFEKSRENGLRITLSFPALAQYV